MTYLHTTDDLLRAARENQEFREAFRREILTDDLIDLPQREGHHYRETNTNIEALTDKITELTSVTENIANAASSLLEVAEATNNRLDVFDSRFDRIDDKIGGLERNLGDKIAEVNEGTNQKIDGMNRDLGEKIEEMRTAHEEEHEALHRFRGNYAIEATRNNRANIARKFVDARGINRHRYSLKTLSDDECNELFDENLDAIELLDTEGNISETFPEGDLIVRANYRRSGDTIFYIAVEASYTINADDVIRASDHAKTLRKATGHEAFSVVSGVRVNPRIGNSYRLRIIEDLSEYLESDREDLVFWFQLADRSLEPPSPC